MTAVKFWLLRRKTAGSGEVEAMQQAEEADVLIIGAGPAGLALAIEMGRLGIECMIVERNDRVGYSPRAKTTNVRTREHLRRWGIAENLRKASKLPADYPSNVVFATRMDAPQLTRIENALCCDPAKSDLYSESAQWVPQYVLEEVLRAHAVGFPSVKLYFNSSFVSAEQDENGVTAVLESTETKERREVRSRYLIGADGARSTVRAHIGAVMSGQHGFAKNYNVQFRAPELAGLHAQGPAIMYWMINDDVPSLLGPMDGEGLWYFIATRIDEKDELDPKAMIRKATHLDFEMEILGGDPWYAHNLIADKYSDGRIFLAGDACHLHPPFGGYGMNMGIGDAVDLGWKMAAVLQGWGGQTLLDSYEQERRPVHKWTMDEAIANYSALGNQLAIGGMEEPGPVGDATRREAGEVIYTAKLREFKSLGAVLGYRYDGSPVVVPDGTSIPVQQSMIYQPSARPGCLAPHLWLTDGSSLYDHFGEGFTLLCTVDDAQDEYLEQCERAGRDAASLAIPLTILAPSDKRLRRRYQAFFALIRPDQHVAWRGDEIPADFAQILRKVTGAYAARDLQSAPLSPPTDTAQATAAATAA